MPFCPSCGTYETSNASFCSKCGASSVPPNNVSSSQSILKSSVGDNKEALTLANQVVLAFLWMLLCEFKGADAAEAFKNIPIYIVAPLVAMAVTYFCVVIKGVKESKANFVLIPAILMAVFYVWALVGSDQSNNNFFDWLSYIIGFIQVGILYRVYMLIKTAR